MKLDRTNTSSLIIIESGIEIHKKKEEKEKDRKQVENNYF